MAPRTTRGSVAKEAAFLKAAEKENVPKQLSSPPATPTQTNTTGSARRSKASFKGKTSAGSKVANVKGTGQTMNAKAKTIKTAESNPVLPVSPNGVSSSESDDVKNTIVQKPSKKRKRVAKVKIEADPNELPHGLGRIKRISDVKGEDFDEDNDSSAKKARSENITITKEDVKDVTSTAGVIESASAVLVVNESPTKKARRAKKANPYGVTLGETPFPDWVRPTPEECQAVNDILSKKHGTVAMPQSIPLPSLTVAGCGEVPCVLEALLRTLLSAHTSNGNAAMAVQGLIKRFGVLKSGMSKGCIDWNAARLAGREEIQEAIKRGGLAKVKSKYIEGILRMVYEENETRRAAIATQGKLSQPTKTRNEIDPDTTTVDPDHEEAVAIEKASEIMLADTSALTLDYVHAMSANAAFAKLITLPGIGVKTASCTLLFCMQRPSFAVDTHVFRLCKWLGWVPENATRDTTFAHCDVRVPDKLKYSLHQLLIKHGKECGRCRAITGEGSEAWEEGCVIDKLVERTGKRKGGKEATRTPKGKKGGKKGEDDMSADVGDTEVDAAVETTPVKKNASKKAGKDKKIPQVGAKTATAVRKERIAKKKIESYEESEEETEEQEGDEDDEYADG
ncbi:hypothetical protein MMC19_002342 [Ptychographa xylographoides]|nr:hypothetical protein [Ptychographa xylographoides]